MNSEPSADEAEAIRRLAAANAVVTYPPRWWHDRVVWFAAFAIAAVCALVLAVMVVNSNAHRAYQERDLLAESQECRGQVAADLRDADSEVIRQNALHKKVEGEVTEALAAIVVGLSRREPSSPEHIDALDLAGEHLAAARAGIDAALAEQRIARDANATVVEDCRTR